MAPQPAAPGRPLAAHRQRLLQMFEAVDDRGAAGEPQTAEGPLPVLTVTRRDAPSSTDNETPLSPIPTSPATLDVSEGHGVERLLLEAPVLSPATDDRLLQKDILDRQRQLKSARHMADTLQPDATTGPAGFLPLRQQYCGTGRLHHPSPGPTADHTHHLATLATEDEYVFAVVGTECQDLSSAGPLQGLQGKHSSVLYDVVNVLGQLQRIVGQHRFVYLIECVAAQHNFNSRDVREVMHPLMCSMIGIPITIDAAQLGARAHRLRNYWSSMACPISAQQVLTAVVRDPNRLVSDILDPGRAERPAACDTARGHYRCNVQGEPMRAWPTMMSFPDSYQFRGDSKGTVWDDATQTWGPPTPEEKERATGFQTGATEAPNVTARQRGEMLGRAFDRCSMGSMAEYSLRSTADATADPRDSDDTEAIPSSGLAQWAQSLHAAQNDAQMDTATLRRLYGKDASPSLMEAAQRNSKEPSETAQAFALHIIARFGCPAEVLTDNGEKWGKYFAQLLKDHFIDHRTTSPSHPQSNGLSERIVQMVKAALIKACAKAGSIDHWETFLSWIMLGYNATPQESTRLSPYELVYAQRPTLPPAIKERISEPLDSCMNAEAMAA
ncbi:hypothetical protein CYMTET_44524 [Cymbomonas tetramitiformis]|uniref:Integrase catalytic domain-containing protein n=1 Tax=Cymbomonas tetramitiformis TaxID=36881 RepID=A0AAE0C018_9CHLO|nr:hypothetical protein CYMTET_44524 [Cymbomonas tetramitiformis]